MTKELKFVGDVREEDEEHRGADFLRRVVQREFQEQRSDWRSQMGASCARCFRSERLLSPLLVAIVSKETETKQMSLSLHLSVTDFLPQHFPKP